MVLALPAQLTLAEASVCLRQLAQGLSEQSTEVALDASALTRFDSAALAVLLELRRQSLARGLEFSVLGLPAPLASLAALYGVSELLGQASAAQR